MPMIISNGRFKPMKKITQTTSNLSKPPMIISNKVVRTIKPSTETTSINLAKTSTIVSEPVKFNSSMITRIHNVKPGCGSCGR